MGAVFVATDERDGTRVAIKVVHAHVSANRSARDRFVREAQAGQSVTHPNVVRTIALESVEDLDGTRDALVLELVEGRTLRDVFREMGVVPEALLREIAAQAAAGL
jgi:serine/threonine-protein kinase